MSAKENIAEHLEENDEEEIIVIIPPMDDLRRRAIKDGSPSNAYRRAIEAAEQAIEQLSSEFGDWLNIELDRLTETIENMRRDGWQEDHADQLYTITHDLKGQATTLGYPTITEICDTLCNLLENIPDKQRLSLNVVEIFVTSIKTIIEQCERNEENQKAKAISLGLRQMALKIMQQELALEQEAARHQPQASPQCDQPLTAHELEAQTDLEEQVESSKPELAEQIPPAQTGDDEETFASPPDMAEQQPENEAV